MQFMNTIYRDGNVKISVYADHAPVHFHVRTPDGDSAVALAKAIDWAWANKPLIPAEWDKLNGANNA